MTAAIPVSIALNAEMVSPRPAFLPEKFPGVESEIFAAELAAARNFHLAPIALTSRKDALWTVASTSRFSLHVVPSAATLVNSGNR